MMKVRDFLLLVILISNVIAISSCAGTESIGETPTAIEIHKQEPLVTPTSQEPQATPTSAETQTTPVSKENQAEFWDRPADGMRMVFVPGGTFQMGSTEAEIEDAIALCRQHYNICNRWYYERESPRHPVALDDFWIDQTEVSNAQYRLCVEAGVCAAPSTCKKGEPTFDDPQKANHPVVCVDWEDAQTYCQWTGSRLPTEAEWEYAFRGETGSIYPWGDEFDGARLNYCDANCDQSHADDRFDDGYPLTAPVGSYPQGASWSGVFNMSGNVSEWVADWFWPYSPEAVSNPEGPPSGTDKMVKGCSWYYHPTYCRGAARPAVDPGTRFDYLGFRCVIPLKEPEEDVGMLLNSIVVPIGDPPIIDGTLSPGEWDNAIIDTFADGSELHLMYADHYLYLGIRAESSGMIAGNVFIQRGDVITISHASAALGTAVYQSSEGSWERVQNFTWRGRSTSNSESAQAERVEFLQEEGWLAVNSWMGIPNELEYQIEITDQDFRLAVNFVRASQPNEKIVWPPNLDDDCIKPTPGGLPAEMDFAPERWATLVLPSE